MRVTDPIGVGRMEALLAGGAPRTPAEARCSSLLSELRRDPVHAPEELRSRVLAQMPAERRLPRPLVRSPRRALLLVPAVLALALLAATVHGFVSPRQSRSPAAAAESAAPAAKPRPTGTPAFGAAVPNAAKEAPRRSSHASRVVRSAAGFLAFEGLIVLAVVAVLGLAAVLVRLRRRRLERQLLGAWPAGDRGDLME